MLLLSTTGKKRYEVTLMEVIKILRTIPVDLENLNLGRGETVTHAAKVFPPKRGGSSQVFNKYTRFFVLTILTMQVEQQEVPRAGDRLQKVFSKVSRNILTWKVPGKYLQ
jgi:hypothetical protein